MKLQMFVGWMRCFRIRKIQREDSYEDLPRFCWQGVYRKKPAGGGLSSKETLVACIANAASLQSGGCELASGAEAVRPTLACSRSRLFHVEIVCSLL